MPKPTDDYFSKLAGKVQQRMDSSTSRLAAKLSKGPITAGDAQNVPDDQWHQMIRQNWGDPQWRADQAFRVGPVKMVQDALRAFGLPPSLLKQNANDINLGLPHTVDASTQFAQANPNSPINEDNVPQAPLQPDGSGAPTPTGP